MGREDTVRDVGALQSVPFDTNGQGAAAQAAVQTNMRASERRDRTSLAQLRRHHATSHPDSHLSVLPETGGGGEIVGDPRFSSPVLAA